MCQRLIPTADGKNRIPALELMVVNGRVQQAIIDPIQTADIEGIVADGEYYGMITFDQSLVSLISSGSIDLAEAMSTASNPHDLKVMLERKGILGTGQFAAASFSCICCACFIIACIFPGIFIRSRAPSDCVRFGLHRRITLEIFVLPDAPARAR